MDEIRGTFVRGNASNRVFLREHSCEGRFSIRHW